MTLIGREQTVERTEHTYPKRSCEGCGRKRAATRKHEYSDRFVFFGHPVITYDSGVNYYCRYCADEPAVELFVLPEIMNQPRHLSDSIGSSAPAFRNVKFRGVNWETVEPLIEYVRTSPESPPNEMDADAVKRIVSSDGLYLTASDYTALRWWIVKALKAASTDRERSRYYDLFCRVKDAPSFNMERAQREPMKTEEAVDD